MLSTISCIYTYISLQSSATFASTYVLVAMSIDRLDAIARPMNFTGSGESFNKYFHHLRVYQAPRFYTYVSSYQAYTGFSFRRAEELDFEFVLLN